jgi:putative ABC transport system ATP-binding protein
MPNNSPLIEIEGLAVEARGRAILQAPAWRVPQGAALIMGPSGAGKTTLLHVLAGLQTPTRGRVCVLGQDMFALAPARRDHFRARNIAIVFQTARLVRALSVGANVALALKLAGKAPDKNVIVAALQRLNIAHLANARAHTLSVGEAQRAAIARALAPQPKLILADEPTSALDDANALGAIDLLLEAAVQFGAGLIVASHDNRITHRVSAHLHLAPPT